MYPLFHHFQGQETAVVLWRDRKDVFALSTIHNESTTSIMKHLKGSHKKRPIACPTIITDYNMYMSGVDLSCLKHNKIIVICFSAFVTFFEISFMFCNAFQLQQLLNAFSTS